MEIFALEDNKYRSLEGIVTNRYKIGRDGTAWSNQTRGPNSQFRIGNWHMMYPTATKTGHLIVCMKNKENKPDVFLVHRLVLLAFVGECPEGMECRHLDGNPRNNYLENLVWGTREENQHDRKIHGTDNSGTRSPNAKLTEEKAIEVLGLWKIGGITIADIGRMFGVDRAVISNVIHNKAWKHIDRDSI